MYDERMKDYTIKYAKEKLKRVPLDLKLSFYNDVLLTACQKSNIGVNTFIKQAIIEKIKKEYPGLLITGSHAEK
jgi:hypothetical protein